MPLICVADTPATCGDPQTGSSVVKIQGKGVSRIGTDTAGGIIIGPGSQNVFVEGIKVSLSLDIISTHGLPPHAVAMTVPGQSKVNASTGFIGDTGGGSGDAPTPDLNITSFQASRLSLACSGQGYFPPTNMIDAWYACNQSSYEDQFGNTFSIEPPTNLTELPTVTYDYTITNNSSYAAQPFVVGFWRFLNSPNAPTNAILTVDSVAYYPDVELAGEQAVDGMAPGATYSGTFEYSEQYLASEGSYSFGIYADIYNTTTEPNENNSAPTITVSVTNGC